MRLCSGFPAHLVNSIITPKSFMCTDVYGMLARSWNFWVRAILIAAHLVDIKRILLLFYAAEGCFKAEVKPQFAIFR